MSNVNCLCLSTMFTASFPRPAKAIIIRSGRSISSAFCMQCDSLQSYLVVSSSPYIKHNKHKNGIDAISFSFDINFRCVFIAIVAYWNKLLSFKLRLIILFFSLSFFHLRKSFCIQRMSPIESSVFVLGITLQNAARNELLSKKNCFFALIYFCFRRGL